MASSPMCKKTLSDKIGYGSAQKNKAEKALIWEVGGWHYCGGAVRIRRAEQSIDRKEQEYLFKLGIEDVLYSYTRIDHSNFWAAEMGTTIAKAYRGLKNRKKAFEYLDQVLKNHPNYEPAHTLYGLTYYKDGQYILAKDHFLRANEITNGHSAQITYFLGLTSLKLGDLENAKKYSADAQQLGYPLKGLENMIAKTERTKN